MATDVRANRGGNSAASSSRGETGKGISTGLRVIITIAVISATLMEVLDTSIVNVALPDMMGNLGATLDDIGWVSTGYIISNVIVLPMTGWFSDYFGRKNYLAGSVVLFTIASFGCGISNNLWELVAFRVIQGAGGAAFLSTSQATLLEIYPPRLQGIAQGIFGIGVVMAPTIGPSLGGYITDNFSWPWIFFINIPIGIIACALTLIYVPNSAQAGKRRRLDFIGVGLLIIGLGSLQTVLERGEPDDWFQSRFIVGMTALAALGMILFVYWVMRPANKNPVVNLRLFKNRNMTAGWIAQFALGLLLLGGVFIIPQFFQNVQAYTAQETGALLIPGGLATALMMPIVGILVNRLDVRILITLGMFAVGVSMYQFSNVLTLQSNSYVTFWPLVLRGTGIGLQFVPLSMAALGTLQPQQVAEGSGLYNLSRQLGGSFGIAILTTLIDQRQHFHYARLGEFLYSGSPMLQERLSALQGGLMARGLASDQAQLAAYKALQGSLTSQSYVMTYVDAFRFMCWVGVGSLLLVFLFERAKHKVTAAE